MREQSEITRCIFCISPPPLIRRARLSVNNEHQQFSAGARGRGGKEFHYIQYILLYLGNCIYKGGARVNYTNLNLLRDAVGKRASSSGKLRDSLYSYFIILFIYYNFHYIKEITFDC